MKVGEKVTLEGIEYIAVHCEEAFSCKGCVLYDDETGTHSNKCGDKPICHTLQGMQLPASTWLDEDVILKINQNGEKPMTNEIKVGDKLKFTEQFLASASSKFNKYRNEVCTLLIDDQSWRPYKVMFPDGKCFWCDKDDVIKVEGTTVMYKFKVGDTVKATAKYIATSGDNRKYLHEEGIITIDDGSSIPYRVHYPCTNDYHWFRPTDIELTGGSRNPQVKEVINKLMEGRTFYTANGTKVHVENGVFKFGTSNLNMNKLVGLELFDIDPTVTPFEIDVVKGTRCKVWDNSPENHRYALVIKYDFGHEYPFITHHGRYKNAVPD